MIGEHCYDVWKARQRLHRGIPRPAVDLREVSFLHGILIVGDPLIRFDDLLRESTGLKDQRQKRIRIQGNRAEKVLEVRDCVDLRRRLRGGCLVSGGRLRRWGLCTDWIENCRPDQECRRPDPTCFSGKKAIRVPAELQGGNLQFLRRANQRAANAIGSTVAADRRGLSPHSDISPRSTESSLQALREVHTRASVSSFA
jgi:hypothetical protein